VPSCSSAFALPRALPSFPTRRSSDLLRSDRRSWADPYSGPCRHGSSIRLRASGAPPRSGHSAGRAAAQSWPPSASVSTSLLVSNMSRMGCRILRVGRDPLDQKLGCLGEIAEFDMWKLLLPAMGDEETFREDQVSTSCYAKVRSPIANHDTSIGAFGLREPAFAVTRQRQTVAAGMGKCQPPAPSPGPRQPIGAEGHVDAGTLQHGADGPVQSVGDDRDRVSQPAAKANEVDEPRIDLDFIDEAIEFFGSGPDEIDLADHTLARADEAGFPLLLDLHPARISESLEEEVGRIERRNRPIEIDEHMKLHTRTRHVQTCQYIRRVNMPTVSPGR